MQFNLRKTLYVGLGATASLAACHSHHADDGTTSPTAASYSATLIDLQIDRTADHQAVPVTGLPASGATLTIQ